MERDNTEKTHREGWLKRVLEEANDYDIPELIDPDEYEESTPDLVPSDEDGVGRVGSDNDGGAIPVLFESEADGSSGGSDEAPQKHSWSHKDMEYEHSNVRENPEDTKSIPCSYKRQGDHIPPKPMTMTNLSSLRRTHPLMMEPERALATPYRRDMSLMSIREAWRYNLMCYLVVLISPDL